MRALWNLQEITTDEAICAWGDAGIAGLNTMTWPDQPVPHSSVSASQPQCHILNDFIVKTQGNDDPDVVKYVAAHRFLRAWLTTGQ
jgi:hypothetical protein